MASNLPDNVTGFELEIAGPDWEEPRDLICGQSEDCEFDGNVDAWGYGAVVHWVCPECGSENEEEGP